MITFANEKVADCEAIGRPKLKILLSSGPYIFILDINYIMITFYKLQLYFNTCFF